MERAAQCEETVIVPGRRDDVVQEQDPAVRRATAVRRQQDVGRPHLPVRHTPLAPRGRRVEHGEPDPGALGRGQRTAPGHQFPQIDGARHVLHDGPRHALVLHHVMNGHHVRMVARPRQVPGPGAYGPQCHLAAQSLIVREPHPVRPAVAERA
ncbi:hypothetical protein ACFW5I_10725 [Streptomyces sp. NPDC058818]|uniref:hypothetical protein n=1 Tax=Streptomyces sp. NPDC058818 TaxID=3346640 RepID=UPI00369FB66A